MIEAAIIGLVSGIIGCLIGIGITQYIPYLIWLKKQRKQYREEVREAFTEQFKEKIKYESPEKRKGKAMEVWLGVPQPVDKKLNSIAKDAFILGYLHGSKN